MPRLQPSIVVAALLIIAASPHRLRAQEADAEVLKQTEGFISPGTLAVVRVDLRELDLAATKPFIERFIGQLREENAQADAAEALQQMAGFKRAIMEDGGAVGPVYLMFGLPTARGGPAVYMVVPLKQGAAGEAAVNSVRTAVGLPHAQLIRGAVVAAGDEQTLAQLVEGPAPSRPAMAQATESFERAVLSAWIVPSEDHRRVLAEMMPQLPPELGGGPITVLTQGLQWASARLHSPAEKSAVIRIQSADAQSAAALKAFIMDRLKQFQPELHLPPREFEQFVAAVTPQQRDSQLVVELSEQQLDELLLETLTPAFARARENAKRVASMSHIKQLMMSTIMHANDHQDVLPAALDEQTTARYFGGAENYRRIMTNPRTNRFPGYIYVRPALSRRDIKDPHTVPIVYEVFETWPGAMSFGFADGHVELVSNVDRAKALLKQMNATMKFE